MAVTKLPNWLQVLLIAVVLSSAVWLAVTLPTLGIVGAALFSSLIVYVPFGLGSMAFERVEKLGRATGQTRVSVDGVYVAETTTTRLGWWVAGTVSALTGLALVAWIALSQGAVHLSW
ncbi:MAG: hypothetical protein ACK46X_03585 [Candidatus Sericytochromatia bacterium]